MGAKPPAAVGDACGEGDQPMSSRTQAEIISVGTELLRGEITDTNAGYLASELPLLGITVFRMTTAGDDREELSQVIRQALDRSPLVITSGGLGPTDDDLTRDCIAAVLDEEMSIDDELERQLRAMFGRMGRGMPEHNLRQANLIPSAKSLPNPRGTAPGWFAVKGESTVVALPGPPRELKPMWEDEVVPRIQSRFPGEPILARTVKTYGIAEAKVSEMVQSFFESANPLPGIYSKPDGIHIRLIAHGSEAGRMLDAAESELTETFAATVWGRDEDTLPGVLCRWLNDGNLTLATIEDGTNGLLANALVEAEGSSSCYRGGIVAGSAEARAAWGVSEELIERHGEISPEVAEAMAVAVRDRFSASIGLSTTPIAGIEGPEGKPPGLAFIAVADAHGTQTWQQNYPPSRGDATSRGAIAALFRLRERLIGVGITDG